MTEHTSTEGTDNPYAPPASDVDGDKLVQEDSTFIPEGRVVPAGQASNWFGLAWNMFKPSALMWILTFLVFSLVSSMGSCIPVGGQVLFALMLGGFMITCARQRETGTLEIGDLFGGFQNQAGPLAILGLIQGGSIVY